MPSQERLELEPKPGRVRDPVPQENVRCCHHYPVMGGRVPPASMQDPPEFLPPTSGCKVAGEHDICFEKLTSTSPAADNCT
jgi:hypothetical protein